MMNAAMDRWGVASSSIYNQYHSKTSNGDKENESKISNGKDSALNERKPLSQKQAPDLNSPREDPSSSHEHQISKILAVDTVQNNEEDAAVNRSFSDGSGSSQGSGAGASLLSVLNRKSASAAEVLAIDSDAGLDLPSSIPGIDIPPPIDNVVRTPRDEEDMNDVSTIAGDTFAGYEMDANLAEAVPPYQRTHGEEVADAMITPTYSVLRQEKKTRRRVLVDDDQSTLPESPSKDEADEHGSLEDVNMLGLEEGTGLLRKVEPNKSNDDDYEDYGFDDDDLDLPKYDIGTKPNKKLMFPTRRRFKCMMCGGCVLASLLLLGIAALAYTLYAIRHEDQGALSLFNKQFWKNAGDKLRSRKDNNDEVDPNEEAGFFDEEFSGTIWPTHTTSTSGTFSGTNSRTIPPSFFDTPSPKMDELRSVILAATVQRELSGINGTAMNDPATVQHSVLEWLSWDAQLDSYSDDKIVQRFALGCFYNSFEEEDSETENDIRASWMTAGDECTEWMTTEKNKNNDNPQTCNENGQIRSIHMENLGLTGTLAPEVALLSESIESIYLTKNSIYGTIPTAFGQLSNLQRLQLSRNSLEGTLNGSELLEPLQKLEIIGAGGNKFSGPLPTQLGSMPSMIYLNIPYNKFTGTIPNMWGTENEQLKHVSLANNDLTGTIPSGLTGIESLKNLFLSGNDLQGDVNARVCVGVFTPVTYNGMNMTIDCESVSCSCCGCNDIAPTTEAATVDVEVSTEIVTNATVATESSISEALLAIVDNPSNNSAAGEEPLPPFFDATDTDVSTTEAQEGIVETTNYASDTLAPGSFPIIDDTMMGNTITILNGDPTVLESSNDFGCQNIEIGFPCYSSGWSIDFELSNRRCGSPPQPPPATEMYDIMAIFQFEGDIETPQGTNVGSTKPLTEALFWATSCGLPECDGVIANGQIYYRNTYPQQTTPLFIPWWPVTAGTMLQMQWLRADADGMAVVIAESRPFLVANRC